MTLYRVIFHSPLLNTLHFSSMRTLKFCPSCYGKHDSFYSREQILEGQSMKLAVVYLLVLFLRLCSVGAERATFAAWIWAPVANGEKSVAGRYAERHNARHRSKRDSFESRRPQLKTPSLVFSRRQCSATLLNAAGPGEEDAGNINSLFIFGLGYVATAVALTFLSKGWAVYGTCTDPRKVKSLGDQGIKAYIFDDWSGPMLQPEPLATLTSASCILSTVPPTLQSGADPVLVAHEAELKWAYHNGSLRWVGYMSSTGVYGDRGGGWVTEKDEPWPSVPRTRARLKAEKAWLRLHEKKGLPAHVFRLAGIYGPGRSALDSVARHNGDIRLAGADDGTMVSRIHAADIVGVVEASIEHPEPGMVVNVADDLPSTRYETLAYGCKLMGFPRQDPDPRENYINRRGGGNKRVDNGKMRALLKSSNRTLIFPDYRTGLRALYDGDGRPFTQDITMKGANMPVTPSPSLVGSTIINGADSQDALMLKSELRVLSRQLSRLETKMDEVLAVTTSGIRGVGTQDRDRLREDFVGNVEVGTSFDVMDERHVSDETDMQRLDDEAYTGVMASEGAQNLGADKDNDCSSS